MDIYFYSNESAKAVIITNYKTFKLFFGNDGYYCGVDLYSNRAFCELRRYFLRLKSEGNLNDYDSIYSANEYEITAKNIGFISEIINDCELILSVAFSKVKEIKK